jgi:hypothetical protein
MWVGLLGSVMPTNSRILELDESGFVRGERNKGESKGSRKVGASCRDVSLRRREAVTMGKAIINKRLIPE